MLILLNMSSVDYYFVSFSLIISSWLISKQWVCLPAQTFLIPQFCTLQTEVLLFYSTYHADVVRLCVLIGTSMNQFCTLQTKTFCSNRLLTHLTAIKDLTSHPKKNFAEKKLKGDLEFYGTGCVSFTYAQFFQLSWSTPKVFEFWSGSSAELEVKKDRFWCLSLSISLARSQTQDFCFFLEKRLMYWKSSPRQKKRQRGGIREKDS